MTDKYFDAQKILDVIDLLEIGKVTTYSDLAEVLGYQGREQALGSFIAKTESIPPCDGARIVAKKLEMIDSEFTSQCGVTLRSEALKAAGVEFTLKDGVLRVPLNSVVHADELSRRRDTRN